MRVARRFQHLLALCLVLVCALWGASGSLSELPNFRGDDIRSDADTHYFVYAWDETPHFKDTLQWWSGPWGQKFRPFYRPLSSLFFWTQYQLFGVNGKWEFTVALLFWHGVTVLLLWYFLQELLGLVPATVALCVWATGLLNLFIMPHPIAAIFDWKDNVETWHAIPHLLCLWCFLRFLRREQAHYRWWALFWFFIALLFKEMAYTAPLLLILLAWHEGRLREKWRTTLRAVMPFFVLAAAMVGFRFWALQGLGFRMGANTQWLSRFLSDIGGGPGTQMLHGDLLPLCAICALLALWQALERQWARAGMLLGAGFGSLALTAHLANMSFTDTASRLLVENEWIIVPYLAALLFLWWRYFQKNRRSQIFGALWAIITYLPLLSGPNTAHIYYFVSIGWAIWLAYGLIDIAELACSTRSQRKLQSA